MTLTGLGFLSLYGSGLLMAFARHPIYGLMVYVLVMFMHPPSRWWGDGLPDLRWSLIAALVTLIAYYMHPSKAAMPKWAISHGIYFAYVVLVIWMLIQWPWALWGEVHAEIVELYVKYLILIYLIYHVVDSDEKLRLFLWSYIIGCFYIGWIAYTTYSGGRFEGFGGPDIGEANAGALALVIGIFAAGPIFLSGRLIEKVILVGLMPFIVNGMVTAASRSAFLALVTGGLLYIYFSPRRYRSRIFGLGILAGVLLILLTNPFFWARMGTLKQAGADVTVQTHGRKWDAGYGRLLIIQAQWKMFQENPLGHGHRGTAALSPYYLEDEQLTGSGEFRARSSHNTLMTMLVEHGVIGALVYIYAVWWMIRKLRRAGKVYRDRLDFRASLVPTMAAILGGITIADVFVDYLKLEPRLWFIAVLMIMSDWTNKEHVSRVASLRSIDTDVLNHASDQLAGPRY
jgi:hypothetical protein